MFLAGRSGLPWKSDSLRISSPPVGGLTFVEHTYQFSVVGSQIILVAVAVRLSVTVYSCRQPIAENR